MGIVNNSTSLIDERIQREETHSRARYLAFFVGMAVGIRVFLQTRIDLRVGQRTFSRDGIGW